jgi:hypothetical protein
MELPPNKRCVVPISTGKALKVWEINTDVSPKEP